MTFRFSSAALSTLIIALVAGCSKSNPPRESAETRGAGTLAIDAANTGTISGVIRFAGAPPARVPIDMDQDPACAMSSKEPNLSEGIIVNQGKLQNVFIYVNQVLENYGVAKASAPAVLDQKGCRYVPHVLGMMTGQTLRVLNSDKAEHNVHPMPRNNAEWNESQMPGGAPKEHVLDRGELMLPITCNQHPWMKMYLNVVSNPFFAVSDGQGQFRISGLPPGDYTIEAVHEKLGTQSAKITVEAHRPAAADFTFKPQ